ncbi:MAG: hypothetical protein IMX00_04935 [Limnochordales bacterium]|nr:hypothetical protein [Limnochordales bacterium]
MSRVQPAGHLILTTVGADLLLNILTPGEVEEGKHLWVLDSLSERESNLSVLTRDYIRSLGERALDALRRSPVAERSRLCPELGRIYALYGDERLVASPEDKHLLVATDAHTSRTAAQVIQRFLAEQSHAAELLLIPQSGPSGLARELESSYADKLAAYVRQGGEVVLNLVGGPEWLREFCSSVVSRCQI